jgi:hypothetical protein
MTYGFAIGFGFGIQDVKGFEGHGGSGKGRSSKEITP